MAKIKILRIFSRLNIGGPATHTILLTAGLHDDQFESLLVKGTEDAREGNMLYMAKEKGIEPIVIREMRRDISLFHDAKAFFEIYNLIRKVKPHIVHTHTAKAGALGRGATIFYNIITGFKLKFEKLRFLRLPKSDYQFPTTNHLIKLVHTFHGHVFKNYFGYLRTGLFLWIERFLALFTDKIITVSENQRNEILKFRIGNRKKVISIPLGLELEKFLDVNKYKGCLKRDLGISPETMLVGIIARLVPIKNHKMFINAVADFKLRNKKLKAKFLIVGDGELKEQLENLVKKRSLKEDIIFLGFRKDLERIYADLDLVVLTSLDEGMPIALIEAMAAGKSVVSTNVGGVSDLFSSITHRKRNRYQEVGNKKSRYMITNCGILVDSNDVKSLSLAIEELLKNNELRKKMGFSGSKIVYPKYDISELLHNMKLFYKKLLTQS